VILKNVRSSLLRFCSDFAEQFADTQAVDFDTYEDESQTPETDLVGISALSIDTDTGLAGCRVMFGVSTVNDTNLFRLYEVMDALFDQFLGGCWLPLIDADTGEQVGRLVVQDGSRLLPVGGGSSRPIQYVMVSMQATKTFKS
jgi:hypothetical protein